MQTAAARQRSCSPDHVRAALKGYGLGPAEYWPHHADSSSPFFDGLEAHAWAVHMLSAAHHFTSVGIAPAAEHGKALIEWRANHQGG